MEIFETLFKRGFAVALVVVVVVCLLLLGFQRSLMYYPRGYSGKRVEESGARQLRYFLVGEGEQVAFLLGEDELPDRIWVFCSGNGALALDWVSFVSSFDDSSVGFCLFELPGYGLSAGSAEPSSVRESMQQLRGALAEAYSVSVEEVDARVCFLGHSIGAATALIGAEEFGAKRLVLIAPFTTMTEMAQLSVGWPLCLLNLHRYDNRARLRSLRERGGKATVFHGTADGLIPVKMSRELEAEFTEQVSLTEIEGAGHNDVIDRASAEIRAAIR